MKTNIRDKKKSATITMEPIHPVLLNMPYFETSADSVVLINILTTMSEKYASVQSEVLFMLGVHGTLKLIFSAHGYEYTIFYKAAEAGIEVTDCIRSYGGCEESLEIKPLPNKTEVRKGRNGESYFHA